MEGEQQRSGGSAEVEDLLDAGLFTGPGVAVDQVHVAGVEMEEIVTVLTGVRLEGGKALWYRNRYVDTPVLREESGGLGPPKLTDTTSAVNLALGVLGLEKHPDKTFIGRVERGFDFLAFQTNV